MKSTKIKFEHKTTHRIVLMRGKSRKVYFLHETVTENGSTFNCFDDNHNRLDSIEEKQVRRIFIASKFNLFFI